MKCTRFAKWYVLQLFTENPYIEDRLCMLNHELLTKITITPIELANIKKELSRSYYNYINYPINPILKNFYFYRQKFNLVASIINRRISEIRQSNLYAKEEVYLENIWKILLCHLTIVFKKYYIDEVLIYDIKWYQQVCRSMLVVSDELSNTVKNGNVHLAAMSIKYRNVVETYIPLFMQSISLSREILINELNENISQVCVLESQVGYFYILPQTNRLISHIINNSDFDFECLLDSTWNSMHIKRHI